MKRHRRNARPIGVGKFAGKLKLFTAFQAIVDKVARFFEDTKKKDFTKKDLKRSKELRKEYDSKGYFEIGDKDVEALKMFVWNKNINNLS